jgi:exodeoxyribonuclease VII small subunit
MARERKAAETPDPASLSFEEAIERLQAIVEELESGSLSLEDSLARYEEGVKLSRRLTQTLDEAEKRIEKLVENPAGAPATEPMEPETGNASEERAAPARPAPRPTGPSGPEELPF